MAGQALKAGFLRDFPRLVRVLPTKAGVILITTTCDNNHRECRPGH
jgi:hypothetical protein